MILLSQNYWQIKITQKKGRGIFAKKDIPPGTIIGDYLGLVIRLDEGDLYQKDGEVYLMDYFGRAYISPDPQEVGIHLINHSCTPNSWGYPYKGHILAFTLRHIFAGEELTISYLLEPKCEFSNCPHHCTCRSKNCSGTMHASKELYKKWMTILKQIVKMNKPNRIRYGKMLPKLEDYPAFIPDKQVFPMFGSENKKALKLSNKTLPSITILRKYIRDSGRKIHFPELNKKIIGVEDNIIFSKP